MVETEKKSLSPGQLIWKRFKQNKLALFGLIILCLAAFIAAMGGLLRQDATKDANDQQIALSKQGLNFRVSTLKVRKNTVEKTSSFQGITQMFFGGAETEFDEIPLHSYTFKNDSIVGFQFGGSDTIAGAPFSYHLLDVAFAIKSTAVKSENNILEAAGLDSRLISRTKNELQSTIEDEFIYTKTYLLGTDKFGRDLLSRLMAGTIVSLSVGLISVFISLILGISLGSIAGYFGGWIDDVITWIINVVWSIPTLLLVIAITFALGKGFVQVFIAVGLTMWVEVARVVRGQVIGLKNLEYIEAARALGFSTARILSRHVLPNILGPVIVISAANFASAILLEAGLSFLGIGAQIPMASWGQMIKENYAYITTDLAYLAILPGIAISTLVLAFMLIGNGLRDAFDTRTS